jgi:hypothetical protein
MANADKTFITITPRIVVTSAGTFESPAEAERAGMSDRRWADYRRLFATLGVPGGIFSSEDALAFTVDRPSILNGDSEKGFVYSLQRQEPQAADLDSYHPSRQSLDPFGGYIVYKRLEPGWYLYLHYN